MQPLSPEQRNRAAPAPAAEPTRRCKCCGGKEWVTAAPAAEPVAQPACEQNNGRVVATQGCDEPQTRTLRSAHPDEPVAQQRDDAHWLRVWGDEEMARGNVSNAQRFIEIADGLDACLKALRYTAELEEERLPEIVFRAIDKALEMFGEHAADEPVAQQPPPPMVYDALGGWMTPSPTAPQPEAPTLANDLVRRLREIESEEACDRAANVQEGAEVLGPPTRIELLMREAAARIESDAALLAASHERERALLADAQRLYAQRLADRERMFPGTDQAIIMAKGYPYVAASLATPDSAASPTGESK